MSSRHENTVTPREAAYHAQHYLRHVSDGWDGYSLDDASEYTAERMIDFLTGTMTYDADIRPLCDEDCEPPTTQPAQPTPSPAKEQA